MVHLCSVRGFDGLPPYTFPACKTWPPSEELATVSVEPAPMCMRNTLMCSCTTARSPAASVADESAEAVHRTSEENVRYTIPYTSDARGRIVCITIISCMYVLDTSGPFSRSTQQEDAQYSQSTVGEHNTARICGAHRYWARCAAAPSPTVHGPSSMDHSPSMNLTAWP